MTDEEQVGHTRRSALLAGATVAGMTVVGTLPAQADVENPPLTVGNCGDTYLVASGSMRAAAVEGYSPNGWPVSSDRSTIGVATFTVPGTAVRLPIVSGLASRVLLWVAERFNVAVERLNADECWGYAYRQNVNSPGVWSNHASGTAIDLNSSQHPNGVAGTFNAVQLAAVRDILTVCRGVVRWGGDYSRTKDEMHFELDVSPTDPRLLGLVNYLNDPTREDPMRNLILAKRTGENAIWVGDGLRRRQLNDPDELRGLQYWIARRGGDPKIETIDDLRVLGRVE